MHQRIDSSYVSGVRASRALFGLFLAAASCGPEPIFRNIEIEIYGVSARASAVTLKVFALEQVRECRGLDRTSIDNTSALITNTWQRDQASERVWVIPELDTEQLTFTVHTLDENGFVMQYFCRELTYEEIGNREFGLINIRLEPRSSP